MRKIILFSLMAMMAFMVSSQNKIILTAGGRSVTATMADNSAARELVSMLADGPLTLSLSDYGGFEKVGALPKSLPTSDTDITTVPGDIMLYLGRNIVVFYGSNSWDYTPLGHIDGATAASVREFLGNGSVALTLSLAAESGVGEISVDQAAAMTVYDLNGNLVASRPLRHGFYIVNGRKTIVR